jgi:hypothetical protein
MAHRVDLRDYGLFSARGGHPLDFLRLGDRAYRWMTGSGPRPNRWLAADYDSALRALGYSPRILITQLIGHEPLDKPREAPMDVELEARAAAELVGALRPRLARNFRERPVADLATCGIAIVGRKRAERDAATGERVIGASR